MCVTEINRAASTSAAGVQILPFDSQCMGAEVLGLSLKQEVAPDVVKLIKDALLQYKVLVLRGQDDVRAEEQIRFTALFGEPAKTLWSAHPQHPEITVISNEVVDGKPIGASGLPLELSKDGRKFYWHTEQPFKEHPAAAILLHLRVLPECGDGDTLFADMEDAYQSLDEPTRDKLLGLSAGHAVNKWIKPTFQPNAEQQKILDAIPDMVHPMVRTHPETGRKSLYVSEGHTTTVHGLSEGEDGEALLQRLYDHSTRPERVYRHNWRVGDLLFWDNRCTMHLATGSEQPRTLYRTMVTGTAPR